MIKAGSDTGAAANFNDCLQNEPPFCRAACPFGLNVPELISRIRQGRWDAAMRVYRDATGFPRTAAALCHSPCKQACPLSQGGSAVELRLLEQACIDFAGSLSRTAYNLPKKKQRVAIVGGGLAGLSCALRLIKKKYHVEIFEAETRIGGGKWDCIDENLFLLDVREQLEQDEYVLHLQTVLRHRAFAENRSFNAVFVATGAGGEDFGILHASRESEFAVIEDFGIGWFAGGSLIGKEGVFALADGLRAASAIEKYLLSGVMRRPLELENTRLSPEPFYRPSLNPIIPQNGFAYTKNEATEEAARCLKCRCDTCLLCCDLCAYTGKQPLRLRDEIEATIVPGTSEIKATPAKRLLSGSNTASILREHCPVQIDLEGFILEGRRSMHRQKKMPWAFHDFWLRDMAFSDGEDCALCMPPPGRMTSRRVFFPGCQLGASDPDLVESAYARLLSDDAETGLLLRCCGAPAEWSGDESLHEASLSAIRAAWINLGSPEFILACPTCMDIFRRRLPDIPVRSLYETFVDIIPTNASPDEPDETVDMRAEPVFAVFDPCAARHDTAVKAAVRRLAAAAGIRIIPLPDQDRFGRCCGRGGQPSIADPDFAFFVASQRISESPLPYIAYCINCRDVFRDAGKPCRHILEFLFHEEMTHGGDLSVQAAESIPAPTSTSTASASERRSNRIFLKERLLSRFWQQSQSAPKPVVDKCLQIGSALLEQMDRDYILEEEARCVVEYCERTGRRFLNPSTLCYAGCKKIGHITLWAEYRPLERDGVYELTGIWAHRVEIEPEVIWNGRKADLDM